MSYNWSSDFTTVNDDLTDTTGLLAMFWNAINERWGALNGTSFGSSAGDYAFRCTGVVQGWPAIQKQVDATANYFVRPGSWAGTTFIKNCKYSDANNTVQDRAFPNADGGWVRRLPRTIYTISQSGSNGQRARFEAQPTSVTYYGVLSTDPLFGTIVSTPPGEQKYSGQYFTYSAGAWSVSTDQASDPDLLTETGTTLLHPGDYVDGHVLNNIRNGINELLVSLVGSTPGAGVGYAGTNIQTVAASEPFAVYANISAGFGTSTVSEAAAQAAFAASGSTTSGPSQYNTILHGSSSNTYDCFATNGGLTLTGASNPNSQNRTIKWLMFPIPPNQGTTNTFDAETSSVVNGQWNSLVADTTSSSLTPVSATYQSTGPSPGSNWPAVPGTVGQVNAEGWQIQWAAAVLNWSVAGGFKYVSGYAGI